MFDWSLKPIERSDVKHSVGKVIAHTSLGRQETPCKLGRSIPWCFKLWWMSCCHSLSLSNSDRSRWMITEQTMIRVRIKVVQHTQCSNTTSITHTTTIKSDQGKACPPNTAWPPKTPDDRESEDGIQQLTPHPRTILLSWQHCHDVFLGSEPSCKSYNYLVYAINNLTLIIKKDTETFILKIRRFFHTNIINIYTKYRFICFWNYMFYFNLLTLGDSWF